MRGFDVLHPMGWDAFGLPAENEAIKRGVPPWETTARNTATYRRQMTLLGCSYDWEREIDSSAPGFYRWTQWFFLLLYRRGLAYRAKGRQWFCPGCQTVLANEQVDSRGVCWRGHTGVHKRDLEQWYFRISAYADALLDDLGGLNWPEHIVAMQRNWIGRSEGQERRFAVFTTRPDTICGMTFAVLAPEHPLVTAITIPEHQPAVDAYCASAAQRSEVDRVTGEREQAGIFTGAYAIHPVNGRRVPIYVADYVLMSHGTGAIMAVPAHDERDFTFASRYDIPAPVVIAAAGWDGGALPAAYTGPGVLVNSGSWDGMTSEAAATAITDWLIAAGLGKRTVQYRMRDWLISRQRYWGAPIPMIHCDACGIVPVPEADLPVLLPRVSRWQPGGDGRSPLANVPEFVNATCPVCGAPAKRETDTMDGFACSSWYFLRFVSPHYSAAPFDPQELACWGNPDLYVGGAEHAVMHLLYARFWTKVMADAGIVPFREPFPRLASQGVMHARDAGSDKVRRMSKSAGNVVTPDEMAASHGADALRIYLLFMAPFERDTIWDEDGIAGARRFLERAWRLVDGVISAAPAPKDGPDTSRAARELERTIHCCIRDITGDIETFAFNTAVSTLMECLNALTAYHAEHGVTPALAAAVRGFVTLLAPFAPFVAEELWERLGESYSVMQQPWPAWDKATAAAETVTLVVQVDGRVRERLSTTADIAEADAQALALTAPAVQRALSGRAIIRTVYVPGKLINLVSQE
jgi:leucyl-tRNA synthetase